ncbi:WhiB family transcriptional regulator [Streptomyces sp. A1277]|uniref:WhiB family transcriptional regulator n=1 Tax=Streptomyces sp. A1277 TaxID=2563103 RepID=UPI00268B917D
MNKTVIEEGICAQTYPDLFFPEKGEAGKTRAAKGICFVCPVRRACLEEALAEEGTVAASHRYGVLGGCSPRERADIAKQQRYRAAA